MDRIRIKFHNSVPLISIYLAIIYLALISYLLCYLESDRKKKYSSYCIIEQTAIHNVLGEPKKLLYYCYYNTVRSFELLRLLVTIFSIQTLLLACKQCMLTDKLKFPMT